MIFLTPPTVLYKKSFLEALLEEPERHEWRMIPVEEIYNNFENFVERAKARAIREEAAKYNLVPETIFWLIDGDKYIGQSAIRHELNDLLLREGGNIGYYIRPSQRGKGYGKKILELVLQEAKKILPEEKALITCDETNVASKKIIEACGGVFENKVEIQGKDIKKLRYWINL